MVAGLSSLPMKKTTKTTPSVVSTSTPAPAAPGGFTLGLDLGDRSHYVCVLDATGQVLHEGTLPNDRVALAQYPAAVVAVCQAPAQGGLGWTHAGEFSLDARPHLCPLPQERISPATLPVYWADRPANPAAGFATDAGNVKTLSVGRVWVSLSENPGARLGCPRPAAAGHECPVRCGASHGLRGFAEVSI